MQPQNGGWCPLQDNHSFAIKSTPMDLLFTEEDTMRLSLCSLLLTLVYFLGLTSGVRGLRRHSSINWNKEFQKIWRIYEPELKHRLTRYKGGEIDQPVAISESSYIVEIIDRTVEMFVKKHLKEALRDYSKVDKALLKLLKQCRYYIGKYDARYNDPLPKSLSRKPLEPGYALGHLAIRYFLTALHYAV
ncbi:hypothetical protein K7432_000742 [Basidiobolus ranarum]|uniref:Uncharacterized protein n=1 Tax=Basidiobolus ranarum TaxID=34480 RepID=A0ABR2X465_9FUNG